PAVEGAAMQQHAGEASDVRSAAEQTGVRRDTAEVVGALVMHLAVNEAAARRVEFRGSYALPLRPRGIEHRLRHAQRSEDMRGQIRVESLAGNVLDDATHHECADVAVDHTVAGRALERSRKDQRSE